MSQRAKAIIRAIVTLILTANGVLVLMGISPLDNVILTEILSYIFGAGSICWVYWKNNNITLASAAGQEVTDSIKALGKEADEELKNGKGEENE